MDTKKYLKLCEVFSYVELCYLEDALNAFVPEYAVNEEIIKNTKNTVELARGWKHHNGKCEH